MSRVRSGKADHTDVKSLRSVRTDLQSMYEGFEPGVQEKVRPAMQRLQAHITKVINSLEKSLRSKATTNPNLSGQSLRGAECDRRCTLVRTSPS